jgi:hypothetical protein
MQGRPPFKFGGPGGPLPKSSPETVEIVCCRFVVLVKIIWFIAKISKIKFEQNLSQNEWIVESAFSPSCGFWRIDDQQLNI